MKIAVRVTNWIGDVVMNLPALTLLREQYPDAEIVAIARPWVAELLQFRQDLVNRCIPFDDKGTAKGMSGFLKFSKGLRRERFDLAIVFTKHFKGALMMSLAGIPKRVGLKTRETSFFLNGGATYKAMPKSGRHQSLNYVEVVEQGLNIPSSAVVNPELHQSSEQADAVATKFLGERSSGYLCVHAGSAYGTAKRWSAEGYAAVIRQFLAKKGARAVLLGVAAESDVNQQIQKAVGQGLINLCGQTTLSESLHVIAAASAFLSNDSGLMHVAGAFGIPQVAVFGPTDPNATFPTNPASVLVHEPVDCSPCFLRHCPIGHDCMKGVHSQRVWQALEKVLPQAP